MERRIQYASTDNVNIAFGVAGNGFPLLVVTPDGGCAHGPEQLPEALAYMYGRLAQHHTLVRLDLRGTGLSDREIPPLSTTALTGDLLAVLDRLRFERADIFAAASAGPVAIAFAVAHPDRVRRLVLWCTSAAGRDLLSPTRAAIDSLAERDWNVYTETLSSASFGWSDAEEARRLAAMIRETTSAAGRAAFTAHVRAMDLTDELPKLRSPALVVHFRDCQLVPSSCASRLAAQLPDAALALFDGNALFPQRDDQQTVVETIDAFLGGPGKFDAPPRARGSGGQPGLRSILFTDIEGSTALTQRLGDFHARKILRQHERITRQALAEHGGSEVKALGDGFLASFDSASKALECAASIQQSVEAFNQRGDDDAIHVRIGINAGEPIADGRDLMGTAVNLAARIAGQASGGQVLVADVVRQLVAGKGFLFADYPDAVVRGFEDPIRVYELRWGKRPAAGRDPDPLAAWVRA